MDGQSEQLNPQSSLLEEYRDRPIADVFKDKRVASGENVEGLIDLLALKGKDMLEISPLEREALAKQISGDGMKILLNGIDKTDPRAIVGLALRWGALHAVYISYSDSRERYVAPKPITPVEGATIQMMQHFSDHNGEFSIVSSTVRDLVTVKGDYTGMKLVASHQPTPNPG